MVNALILAGEEQHPNRLGTGLKAMINIDGKPMVKYVSDSLRGCRFIDKIGIVGPYDILNNLFGADVDYIIREEGSIIDNTIKGSYIMGANRHLLICTSDIPLLTVEALDDFIIRSQQTEAQLCYPIVERKVIEKCFPGMERTYVKVREGVFTGGNIIFVHPGIIGQCGMKAKQLIEYRKNAIKMASVLGWETFMLLLLKRLTISQAEKRFLSVFGINAKAIISDYPELAGDVDKPSDLHFVRQRLS